MFVFHPTTLCLLLEMMQQVLVGRVFCLYSKAGLEADPIVISRKIGEHFFTSLITYKLASLYIFLGTSNTWKRYFSPTSLLPSSLAPSVERK